MTYATGKVAIAICDRCKFKFPYLALRPDGDKPGLRVCKDCWDTKDPYRLPPRKADAFTLRYPRPDVSIAVAPGFQVDVLNPIGAQFTCVLATPFSLLGRMCAGYNTSHVGE